MKYVGSKNRIAKDIVPILTKDLTENTYFYDLFCGGGNLIDKLPSHRKRIANDYDKDVINALLLIRDRLDLLPKNNKEFTEQDYYKVRNEPNHILYGYVAYALSYSGKKWGGWCRDKAGKRDYVAEAYRNAVKQSKNLQNIIFLNDSYDNIELINNSIVYCDIPYKNTTKYKNINFDYEKFYNWVRKTVARYNVKIYISEYSMPNDFTCVWEKEIVSSLTQDTGSKKGVERLFVYKN